MSLAKIVPGVFQVSLGVVNAFLLVGDDVTIIDSGIPGSASKILEAVALTGKTAGDIRRILLTHLHADHVGSAAALYAAAQAAGGRPEIHMHPLDAEAYRQGVVMRPVQPAPGVRNWLIYNLFMKRMPPMHIETAPVEHLVSDGDELALPGGSLKVIHAPGHAAGQVVFLWPAHGGVLFAADACGRMFGGLDYPPIFEDPAVGQATLRKLSGLTFEHAVFGHGAAIRGGAAAQFRSKWA